MSNFILSDFILRLNTASRSRFISVKVKNTVLCLFILEILYKHGIILNFIVDKDYINVFLKYYQNQPIFFSLQIVSRPGKRVYWTLNKLSLNYSKCNFSGFYIISTPKGLVTSMDCILGQNISGEILLKVCV